MSFLNFPPNSAFSAMRCLKRNIFNALVQHADYVLEGVALLERVQVVSLLVKPANDELHSAQLTFR